MQRSHFLTPASVSGRRIRRRNRSRESQTPLVALASFSLILALTGYTPTASGLQQGSALQIQQIGSGNIRAVFVDADGSVWIGSADRVSHYDGEWRATAAVEIGAVHAITRSPDGNLWVAGEAGLARADGQAAWAQVDNQALSGPINALWVSPSGALWAGTERGVAILEDGLWRSVLLTQPDGSPARVRAIAGGPSGVVWLGGDSLHFYEPYSESFQRLPDTPIRQPIQALLVTPATDTWPETLWIGTRGEGIWSRDQTWRHFARPSNGQSAEGIASDDVLALAQDPEGTLWIGTNGGGISLFARDGLNSLWGNNNWRTLTTFDGLAANAIASIAFDQEGAAWLGAIAGLNRFDSRSWRQLVRTDLSEGFDVVTGLVDSAGRIWFGTDPHGLLTFDGQRLQRFTQAQHGLSEDLVRSVVEDRQGALWVGTARVGLARIALTDLISSTRPISPAAQGDLPWIPVDENALGSTILRASMRAGDDSLWFGTMNGVSRYTPANADHAELWQTYTITDGLASNVVSQNALVEDSQGRILVGTMAGVSRFDPSTGAWRTFTTTHGLDSAEVLSLAEASPGTGLAGGSLWAGTRTGGINRFEPVTGRWQVIETMGSPVYALLATGASTLWIGTAAGLTRLDLATRLKHTYSRADGLGDNEVHMLLEGSDGSLWIGTRAGITRHHPDTRSPSVHFTAINGKIPEAGRVRLLAGDPIVLSFHGVDLLTPARELVYRLRVRAVAPEWRVTREPQITFAGWAPGSYAVEVETIDSSLNRSPTATVIVDVAPTTVVPWLGRLPSASAGLLAGLALTTLAATGIAAFVSLRQRRRRRRALHRRFNPYISGGPVMRSEMFFGRQEIVARILDTLHENRFMIHGEHRIGKTSLLHHLAHQLRQVHDPGILFVPVYIDLEGTLEEDLFHMMMVEIAAVLPAYLPTGVELRFHAIPALDYGYGEFSQDLDAILLALDERTTRDVHVILLVDEMDVMNTYDATTQQQVRRIFMRTHARSLGAIVAGVELKARWERVDSPWYNLFNEIELGPLDETAARHLVQEPVKGLYTFAPEAVTFIVTKSHGRPYLLQQHCLETINGILAAGRTHATLDDVRKALAAVRNTGRSGAR